MPHQLEQSAMIKLVLAIFGTLFIAANEGADICSADASTSVRIHWSERQDIQSPHRRWSVQICPTENGPADAYLKSPSSNDRRLLFRLNRDGIINWGKDDNWLLLEDQQFSNTYRLMLFKLSDTAESETEAIRINQEIRADVQLRLMPTENINYYFPKFAAWDDGEAVISVGIMAVNGKLGPFSPHCFGYKIKTRPLKILSILSEADLKKKYGASCQIWP
jgi:hypothetical protein